MHPYTRYPGIIQTKLLTCVYHDAAKDIDYRASIFTGPRHTLDAVLWYAAGLGSHIGLSIAA